MTFTQSIQSVFSKYVTFSGRASRSEFWYFYLFVLIISVILSGLGFLFGSDGQQSVLFQILEWIFGLIILLPNLSVTVRRLHDIGKGGGWIFIQLLPLIGTVWLLILEIMPSEQGENRFGEEPA